MEHDELDTRKEMVVTKGGKVLNVKSTSKNSFVCVYVQTVFRKNNQIIHDMSKAMVQKLADNCVLVLPLLLIASVTLC